MAPPLAAAPDRAQDMLARITAWPHWNTIKHVAQKEYGMTNEQFETALPEYQRFLGLIALGYTGLGMCSHQIDQIWHAHLLHTQLYESFTHDFVGHFVHHVPLLQQNTREICEAPPTPPPICEAPPTPPPFCEAPPTPAPGGGGDDDEKRFQFIGEPAERFRAAYLLTYGHEPPAIWSLNEADAASA